MIPFYYEPAENTLQTVKKMWHILLSRWIVRKMNSNDDAGPG